MEEQPYNHPVLEYEKPSFEQQEDVLEENYFVKLTFYITYVFLMTTATITFIESITTDDVRARHILNLETCISVVATFFLFKVCRTDRRRRRLQAD